MKTIDCSESFFRNVITYNFDSYIENPESLPAAFNVAISLHSMHDWVWSEHQHGLVEVLKKDISSKRDFCACVADACVSFKYIRDVANASKHVLLSSPSTSLRSVREIESIDHTTPNDIWDDSLVWDDRGKWGRGAISIKDGETWHDFEEHATLLLSFWNNLLQSLKDYKSEGE